ncbi:MAG: NAD(P)-dependent oxidoreductase [Galbitalea sp.]
MSEAAGRAVAFIGLGNMGTPMSARLVQAGFAVRAFDLSADARTRAAAGGAEVFDSAAVAAESAAILILMLPNSEIVASVVDQLLEAGAIAPGSLVVDMSSSEPMETRKLAARLDAAGIGMVDAPVSGGVKGAVNGTLTIMTGGPDDSVARVASVLAPLGKVKHAGAIGAGHAVKALNNLLSATHLWVTSEAIEVGRRFGLDPAVMLDIFNDSSGRSGSTENKWPNFILPGTFNSGFGLRLMVKDMKIAVQLAESTDSPSQLGQRAVDLWGLAAAELDSAADHTEVARWIAEHPEEG